MINIDYDSWGKVVNGILKDYKYSPYIQLKPFSKLSIEDIKFIKSEKFFNKFVKSGAFTYYPSTWLITNAYLNKSNGTYRKATNISPIFYLFITAFTKHISKFYNQIYEERNIITYYSGNILENRFTYKVDYNLFCKHINNI